MSTKLTYTDREIVDGILANDERIIQHFFFRECKPLFAYIVHSIFDGHVERNELINELFLYLKHDDWYKVRQFDYRSKLITWISVVAIRFFQKKMDVRKAIDKMPNERYKYVIVELELKEREPEELAKEMNITIDNLYNIRRRARLQLKTIMVRKEDYYD